MSSIFTGALQFVPSTNKAILQFVLLHALVFFVGFDHGIPGSCWAVP